MACAIAICNDSTSLSRPTTPAEARRRSAWVSRKLRLLRAHGVDLQSDRHPPLPPHQSRTHRHHRHPHRAPLQRPPTHRRRGINHAPPRRFTALVLQEKPGAVRQSRTRWRLNVDGVRHGQQQYGFRTRHDLARADDGLGCAVVWPTPAVDDIRTRGQCPDAADNRQGWYQVCQVQRCAWLQRKSTLW